MACLSSKGDKGDDDRIAAMFGPGQVDQTIRQAIHFCWMSLPQKRRNAEEVEKEMRRIVDRALRDFRDDSTHFGLS